MSVCNNDDDEDNVNCDLDNIDTSGSSSNSNICTGNNNSLTNIVNLQEMQILSLSFKMEVGLQKNRKARKTESHLSDRAKNIDEQTSLRTSTYVNATMHMNHIPRFLSRGNSDYKHSNIICFYIKH